MAPRPGPGPSPIASRPTRSFFSKPTVHPQGGCLPPSLHAAGTVTQLPLNLGKGVEGQVSCPDASSP